MIHHFAIACEALLTTYYVISHITESFSVLHTFKVPTMYDIIQLGFPGAASAKEPACQCRRHKKHAFDPWIAGSGRSPGGGHGNSLQYSCLENPMDRAAWRGYSPYCHKESDMTEVT